MAKRLQKDIRNVVVGVDDDDDDDYITIRIEADWSCLSVQYGLVPIWNDI